VDQLLVLTGKFYCQLLEFIGADIRAEKFKCQYCKLKLEEYGGAGGYVYEFGKTGDYVFCSELFYSAGKEFVVVAVILSVVVIMWIKKYSDQYGAHERDN
jgi:hypothetical protein